MSDQPKPAIGKQLSGRIWPLGHDQPKPTTGESCTCSHATCACPVHWPSPNKPKPTTGEWTAERLARYFSVTGNEKTFKEICVEISVAINAALDAEKRTSDELGKLNDDLQTQLAAAQAANERLKSLCQDVRGAVESAVHDRLKQSWLLKFKEIEELTDTAALDAAKKEAQQPLVECLNHLIFSNHGFRPDSCHGCAQAQRLAKVKEGK